MFHSVCNTFVCKIHHLLEPTHTHIHTPWVHPGQQLGADQQLFPLSCDPPRRPLVVQKILLVVDGGGCLPAALFQTAVFLTAGGWTPEGVAKGPDTELLLLLLKLLRQTIILQSGKVVVLHRLAT